VLNRQCLVWTAVKETQPFPSNCPLYHTLRFPHPCLLNFFFSKRLLPFVCLPTDESYANCESSCESRPASAEQDVHWLRIRLSQYFDHGKCSKQRPSACLCVRAQFLFFSLDVVPKASRFCIVDQANGSFVLIRMKMYMKSSASSPRRPTHMRTELRRALRRWTCTMCISTTHTVCIP
jgi:hypothetical protein